jgi:hypothetical protein
VLTPDQLLLALGEVGIRTFGVELDSQNPALVRVFLDHRDGLWGTGQAEFRAARIPGVIQASETLKLPAVLIVRVAQDPG